MDTRESPMPSTRTHGGRYRAFVGGVSRALPVLSVCALLAGCFDQATAPNIETDGRLTITNSEALLAQRAEYLAEDVPIGGPAPAPSMVSGPAAVSGPALAPSSINLTLVAQFAPPTVGGQVLQATSVWMTANDKTIVSYNMIGLPQLGALDHYTKLLNNNPKLESSVSFADADASAVVMDGSWAYAATASSSTSFAFPSVLERIKVAANDRFQLDPGNMRIGLTSFAATSAMATANEVYVTSGNTGDVFAYNKSTMALVGQYALADARWVAWDDPGNRVVVLQGTPGRLAVFQESSFPGGSMTLLNTWNVPGVDVAEAKSAFEIAGGKAFVATGPQGVQIVCLATGAIIGTVPRPNPASLGLDPSVVQTNSVTVSGDLMFISNGEAGVYAAAGSRSFTDTSCSSYTITVLGQLQFASLQSVNHVMYRNGNLFIAAGLGGIKVVDVDVQP